ncbi:hypothetical protein [Xanthomonas campestris]|uniref:hypothetical protein n=1 Tax=Xanthomonas campestris TaxID=339 RepID=UPI002B22AC11|nr:hypothetical protein [Xanthomonas campestris]MEA9559119.1 hypothetical protein [Xanthomonas campestris]MEA9723691.1 hypothetical protein [Xanthomonas campestris]MEB1883975.1 hypothetical protein [Xanthomonas campestris pv. campestris]
MKTADVIALASAHLSGLRGHEFDVLEVAKPVSPAAAINLAKIVSKLSPLVGNLIEFNTCEYLNEFPEFDGWGHWHRQDPGFPDTVFLGKVVPTPGFEIKAWFPLATEITARFKDSQNHFTNNNTYVAMLAWLPEFLIFGKPHVVDIVVVSGASVAKARDDHYHNPPDYLVIEPNDTAARTANLQQTNTAGYKFQGTPTQFAEARALVASWGPAGSVYSPAHDYQARLAQLMARFPYRLDTNFAKMDRIVHAEIEAFKLRTYGTVLHGRTIGEWNRLLSRGGEAAVALALANAFDIREGDGESVVEP